MEACSVTIHYPEEDPIDNFISLSHTAKLKKTVGLQNM